MNEPPNELTGHLLIAGPDLWDPNFRHAVVLIGHHDAEGAVGVVLNRASGASVAEVVPPLAALAGPDAPLYVGGPVQPEAAVVVAEFERPDQAGMLAFGHIGFLLEDPRAEDVAGVRRARVYSGYAGWGPGQLEAELAQGSWYVAPALPEDVFVDEPEALWSRAVRRMGGREFRLLATMPPDPSLN